MIHKIIFTRRNSKSKKALFLDRDGVINKNPPKHDYVKNWKEFKFNNNIFDILKEARDNKYKIIVVTNQRGIARGLYTNEDFQKITNRMFNNLKKQNLYINAVYYCPHEDSENCKCRKPKAGLILQAVKDFNINPAFSIMVGDSLNDKKAGIKAKVGRVVAVKTDLKEQGIVDKIFMR